MEFLLSLSTQNDDFFSLVYGIWRYGFLLSLSTQNYDFFFHLCTGYGGMEFLLSLSTQNYDFFFTCVRDMEVWNFSSRCHLKMSLVVSSQHSKKNSICRAPVCYSFCLLNSPLLTHRLKLPLCFFWELMTYAFLQSKERIFIVS